MATTDTSEKGLETLIMRHLTGADGLPSGTSGMLADAKPLRGGSGWFAGSAASYDREFAVDVEQLFAFLHATQPDETAKLGIGDYRDKKNIACQKFLARLQGEISRRGTIDVLRHGIKHGALGFDLFFGTPSPENKKAVERHAANRFSITRQLAYSREETKRALDLCAFINGLPVTTFELKNSLTKQTVEDAIEQYKRDRDPRETLFQFGRCVVHFAVDDVKVAMCTALKGARGMAKESWFLPFDQGWNDGAGNPPNPDGLKTDYLWKRILTPAGLTDILENYAQIVEEENPKTGKRKQVQVFPRYHQLDVVRKLLADVGARGSGQRYLIQHSAGSGKSNSIAWLAHQLISARKDGKEVFDSIIVVTDRRILDQQIRETIKGFAQVGGIIGAVKEGAGVSKTEQLSKFLKDGKKIIISTVQTFPFVLDSIGAEHRGGNFAILIDEAHSSQGGAHGGGHQRGAGRERRGGRGDHRGQDQPHHRAAEDAAQRQLLRLHRHTEEQDAGDVRHRVSRGRRGEAPSLPRLHDEAGDPGGLHPRRAQELHARGQLLPAGQDHRGRPGVRREEGAQEAAPLRREPQ